MLKEKLHKKEKLNLKRVHISPHKVNHYENDIQSITSF